jgi:hypothetical protein
MIKPISEKRQSITIDLTGPEGNAFYLIGKARQLGLALGKSTEEIADIQIDMTSGDYEHLLKVFEDNFGTIVTLYR